MANMVNVASFWPEALDQIVLPDRTVLKGQKLMENAKIKKNRMRLFGWFSAKCTNDSTFL